MHRILFSSFGNSVAYLIASYLIFPVSFQLSFLCFGCFFIGRLSAIRISYYGVFIKTVVGIIIAIAMFRLYKESRSDFYPVSIYDYLLLIITIAIVKINPLKINSIYQTCWGICLSLLVSFICYLPRLNFGDRNDWGFGNPNWLGLYCSMCLPIVLCMAIYQFRLTNSQPSIHKRLLNTPFLIPATALVAALIMLISSGSRSGLYTSLLAIILIFITLKHKYSLNGDRKLKLLLINSSIAFFLSLSYKLFFTKFTFLDRFIDLGSSTNIYRLRLYRCHMELGWQKPWTGWGINHVSAVCEQKFKAGYGGVNHAHSFVVQLFADCGLIVTISCVLLIFYYLILPTLELLTKANLNSKTSAMSVGISLSCISILIASLFQSGFYHYPLFPLWLGLLWGCQSNLVKN